jgi:hypothetical protein
MWLNCKWIRRSEHVHTRPLHRSLGRSLGRHPFFHRHHIVSWKWVCVWAGAAAGLGGAGAAAYSFWPSTIQENYQGVVGPFGAYQRTTIPVVDTPEPSSLVLMGTGLALVIGLGIAKKL